MVPDTRRKKPSYHLEGNTGHLLCAPIVNEWPEISTFVAGSVEDKSPPSQKRAK